jgi:hypothetical protein
MSFHKAVTLRQTAPCTSRFHIWTLRYWALRGTANTSGSHVVSGNIAADANPGRAICGHRGLARAAGVGSDVRPNASLPESCKQGHTLRGPDREKLCGLCGSSVHDRVVRDEYITSIPPTRGKKR